MPILVTKCVFEKSKIRDSDKAPERRIENRFRQVVTCDAHNCPNDRDKEGQKEKPCRENPEP